MEKVSEARFVDITHQLLLVIVLRAIRKTNPQILQDVNAEIETLLSQDPGPLLEKPLRELQHAVLTNELGELVRDIPKH